MKLSIPKMDPLVRAGMVILALKVSFSYSQFLYYPAIDGLLYRLGLLIMVLAILRKGYPVRVFLAFAVVSGLALYSAVMSTNFGFLITVITCFAIYKENIRNVLKTIFLIELSFFVTHTILTVLAGILIGTPISMQISGATRYNFGLTHPNTFSLYYFQLVLLWVTLYYPNTRHKSRSLFLMLLLSFVIFRLTISRTMFVSLVLLYLLLLLELHDKSKWINRIAKYVFPVTAVLMIGFYMLFSSQFLFGNSEGFLWELNTLLSSRIKLGAYGYSHYGLTLFGQNIEEYGFKWDETWRMVEYYTDGIFPLFAINIGLIWVVVLSVLFYRLAEKKNTMINIMIIVWTLYGISETHVINGYVCFPIFLVMQTLQRKSFAPAVGMYKKRYLKSELVRCESGHS